jgi:hypothetical protein
MMASSVDFDTDSTSASLIPSGRASGLCLLATKTADGCPSHAALYTIVSPSGVKRAPRTSPRRNVMRRKTASGVSALACVAYHQPPNAAPAMATTNSNATSSGDTRRFGFVNDVRGRAVV